MWHIYIKRYLVSKRFQFNRIDAPPRPPTLSPPLLSEDVDIGVTQQSSSGHSFVSRAFPV